MTKSRKQHFCRFPGWFAILSSSRQDRLLFEIFSKSRRSKLCDQQMGDKNQRIFAVFQDGLPF